MTTIATVFAQCISVLDRTPISDVVSMKIPDVIDGQKQCGLTPTQLKHLVGQATENLDSEWLDAIVVHGATRVSQRNYVVKLDEQVVIIYQYEECGRALIELFCDAQF